MDTDAASVELDIEGTAAPPRLNGELVFSAPWEGRAFGMVMSLCATGAIDWVRFREHLIECIAEWERQAEPKPQWSYYARWLAALERSLTEKQLLSVPEIEQLFRALESRPHGHDHPGG